MNDLVITHGITQRRACRLFAFERFVGRYKHKIKNDSEFKDKLLSIVPERRRFGYRRACILLNKERLKINHKRVYRLYKEAGLKVRKGEVRESFRI